MGIVQTNSPHTLSATALFAITLTVTVGLLDESGYGSHKYALIVSTGGQINTSTGRSA